MTAKEKWVNQWGDQLVDIVAEYKSILLDDHDGSVEETKKEADRLRSTFVERAERLVRDLIDLRIVERWPRGQDPGNLLSLLHAAGCITSRTI